jgi:hypothetical protein
MMKKRNQSTKNQQKKGSEGGRKGRNTAPSGAEFG